MTHLTLTKFKDRKLYIVRDVSTGEMLGMGTFMPATAPEIKLNTWARDGHGWDKAAFPPRKDTLIVCEVAVAARYRNQGLAKTMVHQALLDLKKTHIVWSVFTGNAPFLSHLRARINATSNLGVLQQYYVHNFKQYVYKDKAKTTLQLFGACHLPSIVRRLHEAAANEATYAQAQILKDRQPSKDFINAFVDMACTGVGMLRSVLPLATLLSLALPRSRSENKALALLNVLEGQHDLDDSVLDMIRREIGYFADHLHGQAPLTGSWTNHELYQRFVANLSGFWLHQRAHGLSLLADNPALFDPALLMRQSWLTDTTLSCHAMGTPAKRTYLQLADYFGAEVWRPRSQEVVRRYSIALRHALLHDLWLENPNKYAATRFRSTRMGSVPWDTAATTLSLGALVVSVANTKLVRGLVPESLSRHKAWTCFQLQSAAVARWAKVFRRANLLNATVWLVSYASNYNNTPRRR